MKKEFLGQPVWLWAIGAAVIVGGYLWIKHSQSASSSTTPSQGTGKQGTATGGGQYTFTEWLTQHQGSPGGGSGGGGGKGKGPGPERQWLINKTGSPHPWTYLAQHHEQIRVGPTGSRVIVKKG